MGTHYYEEQLKGIEKAITYLKNNQNPEAGFSDWGLLELVTSFILAMEERAMFIVPVEISEETIKDMNPEQLREGDVRVAKSGLGFDMRRLTGRNGKQLLAAFTSRDEAEKGPASSTVTIGVEKMLDHALTSIDDAGIVLNPWSDGLTLDKEMIKFIFRSWVPAKSDNTCRIVREDITKIDTDCIVTSTNRKFPGASGVDKAIHEAAGPELARELRGILGKDAGYPRITGAYGLPSRYVVHVIAPDYKDGYACDKLSRCYWESLELARKKNLHSIAFPAIGTGHRGYRIDEAVSIAISTVEDWFRIHQGYGMDVKFVCNDDCTLDLFETMLGKDTDRGSSRLTLDLFNKAINQVTEWYAGEFDERTGQPRVLHSLGIMKVLGEMDGRNDVLIAALFIDPLRDGKITTWEILRQYGMEVAEIVGHYVENPDRTWFYRKEHFLTLTRGIDTKALGIVLAEAVVDLREMNAAYKKLGNRIWRRFGAPRKLWAWYFDELQDLLECFQNYRETASLYWEMVGLSKDLFTRYFYDSDEGKIYQLCESGSAFVLGKGVPKWDKFTGIVPEAAKELERKTAERYEDNWAEPFWEIHDRDLEDEMFEGSTTDDRVIRFLMDKEELTVECLPMENEDKNDEAEQSVESYRLDELNTHRLLVQLRYLYPLDKPLENIFDEEFAGKDGIRSFVEFCEKHGINFKKV